MNDFELEKKLKSARTPEWPEDYWEDFPRQVMAGLRRATPARESKPAWRRRLGWGLGVAFACFAIVFFVGQVRLRIAWSAKTSASPRTESDFLALLQNRKLLREILTMFPNRVRAIEQDASGMNLVLSEKPDVPVSTPLWIEICDGQNCRTAVTFSGQELQLGGKKIEVLADPRGQVILTGNNFVWSSAEPDRDAHGLRIRARVVNYMM